MAISESFVPLPVELNLYSTAPTIRLLHYRPIRFHSFLKNGDLRGRRLPMPGIIKAIL